MHGGPPPASAFRHSNPGSTQTFSVPLLFGTETEVPKIRVFSFFMNISLSAGSGLSAVSAFFGAGGPSSFGQSLPSGKTTDSISGQATPAMPLTPSSASVISIKQQDSTKETSKIETNESTTIPKEASRNQHLQVQGGQPPTEDSPEARELVDDVLFVREERMEEHVTAEEMEGARRLQLPDDFYAFEIKTISRGTDWSHSVR